MADDFWNTGNWVDQSTAAFDVFSDGNMRHGSAALVSSNDSSIGSQTQGVAREGVLLSSELDMLGAWWSSSDQQPTLHVPDDEVQNEGNQPINFDAIETQPASETNGEDDFFNDWPQSEEAPGFENAQSSHTILIEVNRNLDPHDSPAASKREDTIDPTSDGSSDGAPDDSDLMIGSIHYNGRFKCLQPSCVHKSFKRQAELKRHFDTMHAVQKPQFWCRVNTCPRSRANGGYPFPRRDKRRDHMRKVHGRS